MVLDNASQSLAQPPQVLHALSLSIRVCCLLCRTFDVNADATPSVWTDHMGSLLSLLRHGLPGRSHYSLIAHSLTLTVCVCGQISMWIRNFTIQGEDVEHEEKSCDTIRAESLGSAHSEGVVKAWWSPHGQNFSDKGRTTKSSNIFIEKAHIYVNGCCIRRDVRWLHWETCMRNRP